MTRPFDPRPTGPHLLTDVKPGDVVIESHRNWKAGRTERRTVDAVGPKYIRCGKDKFDRKTGRIADAHGFHTITTPRLARDAEVVAQLTLVAREIDSELRRFRPIAILEALEQVEGQVEHVHSAARALLNEIKALNDAVKKALG